MPLAVLWGKRQMSEDSDSQDASDIPPIYTHPVEQQIEIAAALAGAIPFAGSVASEIIRAIAVRRQNRRLNEWLESLRADLDRLGEASLNRGFLESEEFHDLFEEIATRVADTRQDEKLDAYRALFVNTVTAPEPSFDRAAEIASLVDRWQPAHIVLLRELTSLEGKIPFSTQLSQNPAHFARQEAPRAVRRAVEHAGGNLPPRRVVRDFLRAGVLDYTYEIRTASANAQRLMGVRPSHRKPADVRGRVSVTKFGECVTRYLSSPE